MDLGALCSKKWTSAPSVGEVWDFCRWSYQGDCPRDILSRISRARSIAPRIPMGLACANIAFSARDSHSNEWRDLTERQSSKCYCYRSNQ